MIIYEYKSDSTIIKFEDTDISTKENSNEILNILTYSAIKKISEGNLTNRER